MLLLWTLLSHPGNEGAKPSKTPDFLFLIPQIPSQLWLFKGHYCSLNYCRSKPGDPRLFLHCWACLSSAAVPTPREPSEVFPTSAGWLTTCLDSWNRLHMCFLTTSSQDLKSGSCCPLLKSPLQWLHMTSEVKLELFTPTPPVWDLKLLLIFVSSVSVIFPYIAWAPAT